MDDILQRIRIYIKISQERFDIDLSDCNQIRISHAPVTVSLRGSTPQIKIHS